MLKTMLYTWSMGQICPKIMKMDKSENNY